MAAKIFYRERRKIQKGEKSPRFTVAAVSGANLSFVAEHYRRSELEQIADEIDADLILLTTDKGSGKYKEPEAR